MLFLTPPPIGFAGNSLGSLTVLASWTAMVRELPLIEERWPAGNGCCVSVPSLSAPCWYVNVDGEARNAGRCVCSLRAALQVAGIGLALRGSVHPAPPTGYLRGQCADRGRCARMLVLGLACAVLAVALTRVDIPVMAGQPSVVNPY